MAAIPSSTFVPARSTLYGLRHNKLTSLGQRQQYPTKHSVFRVQAAKLPPGVVVPKVEPKFKPAFLGFTTTAEVWNSRASMIGLIGVFIVELILNKGILQLIGVEIGKGLDLPL
ncbi:hypothetical protein BVRB_2g040200 [Beta vulgaris subsp. vulgaris]|nr:hypothetical protein BVRB_2g040200 [Beta vulgaris subsp. vulgaris]